MGDHVRPVGSKYVLEEPLGRGATGTVWRGRQREAAGAEAAVAGHPGELVAIKVLSEELATDPDVVMRFLRERSVLLRLTADNIVRVRDLVVEGELLALVMDLIDGPDLHRYLYENGPLTPVGAALLTAQIADALAAAHARGVVHRDLKPANVLLAGGVDGAAGGSLRPMLTDFGIARLADSPGVTRAHEFVGSPSYVAPESAEGREQTSAVDVYGAGIVLYELLTGHPPFSGGSTLQILQRHLSEEPPRPAGVPDPLWTVIERCLRKSPDERPSAPNLARALRTVAAGIGEYADPEQRSAALGVAALLAPDPNPVTVPRAGLGPAGAAEPTQVLPGGSGGGSGGGFGPDVPNGASPQGGPDLDATRAMPAQGSDPHPWQDQLRAARDRNEPTQVQPLDPAQDPLYRAPQRQPQRRPQPQQPPPAQHGAYGYPPPYQQTPPYQQSPPYQQGYQGEPYPPQPAPPPQHRPRPAAEPRHEPRGRSRSASPMRIPGLGCLKGCLVMVLVLVAIAWLVWNMTPLPEWVAEGRSFWEATMDWFEQVGEFFGLVEDVQNGVEDVQNSVPGA